jgi:hypothetical protein
VWFVLTDASDRTEASRLGIEYAPALLNSVHAPGPRSAEVSGDRWVFAAGTVDFSPRRQIVPGDAPNFFPPKVATPGSVGDADYSPLVKVEGTGVIYNAPILAFDVDASQIDFCQGAVDYDRVHDKVVAICPRTREVTLKLSQGFADEKRVVYTSFDASVPLAAAMEAATLVSTTAHLRDDGATLDIYAVANGATGTANPDRQGFNSALAGEGSPLNVLDGLPSMTSGYSPLWDLNLGVWSDQAINHGDRVRLTSALSFGNASAAGLLTSPAGGPVASTGIVVNCPVVAVLDGAFTKAPESFARREPWANCVQVIEGCGWEEGCPYELKSGTIYRNSDGSYSAMNVDGVEFDGLERIDSSESGLAYIDFYSSNGSDEPIFNFKTYYATGLPTKRLQAWYFTLRSAPIHGPAGVNPNQIGKRQFNYCQAISESVL